MFAFCIDDRLLLQVKNVPESDGGDIRVMVCTTHTGRVEHIAAVRRRDSMATTGTGTNWSARNEVIKGLTRDEGRGSEGGATSAITFDEAESSLRKRLQSKS